MPPRIIVNEVVKATVTGKSAAGVMSWGLLHSSVFLDCLPQKRLVFSWQVRPFGSRRV